MENQLVPNKMKSKRDFNEFYVRNFVIKRFPFQGSWNVDGEAGDWEIRQT